MEKSKVYFSDRMSCYHQEVFLRTNIQKCECEGHHEHSHDHFKMTHPDTEWESCLKHAEEIGLGTREYELKTI